MFSYLNKLGIMCMHHYERQFIEWVSEWVLSTAMFCLLKSSSGLFGSFLRPAVGPGPWPPVENQCIEGSLVLYNSLVNTMY